MKKTLPQGFTVFFAALVSSLALAVGLAIYDITVRELDLSATASQSQYAIYAADTGAECALYWDVKYNTNQSAYATSSASTGMPTSGILCNTQDVALYGTPPTPIVAAPTGWTPWSITTGASVATTTFYISFLPSVPYCAMVEVGKSTDSNGITYTNIVSHGYNTCFSGGVTRLERTLQVTY